MLGFSLLCSCAHLPKKNPKIIAHRGASGYLPEHTLESYSLAYGMGADYIEPDVVLSKDNIPVILHDVYLESTTNVAKIFPERKRKDGHYYALDFTLAEIKKLKVNERKDHITHQQIFSGRFPSSVNMFQVPSLAEFLQLMKGLNKSGQKKIGIYPEIKRPDFHRKSGKDITKIVYQMIKDHGYENTPEQIFLQSFDPLCLKRLKFEFKTKIPLIQLVEERTVSLLRLSSGEKYKGLKEIKLYATGLGSHYHAMLRKDKNNQWKRSNLANKAKEHGLLLHPYTLRVDQVPDEFSSFDELVSVLVNEVEVDGFFSDFTDQTKQAIAKL